MARRRTPNGRTPAPRWYALRPAQNRKPATYRCPLCGQHLPALMEHTLLLPEGRSEGRRHAHTACVIAARNSGRLRTRDEYEATLPRSPGRLQRLRARLRAR